MDTRHNHWSEDTDLKKIALTLQSVTDLIANHSESKCVKVSSSKVLLGSVLELTLFNMFTSDLEEQKEWALIKFVHDTKLVDEVCALWHVAHEVNMLCGRAAIQGDLVRLEEGANMNLMKFRKDLCKMVNSILSCIKRIVAKRPRELIIPFHSAFVILRLECCGQIWETEHLTYEQRLREIDRFVQPYEEKAQGESYCHLQVPNGRRQKIKPYSSPRSLGRFPNDQKKASAAPAFKKGDPQENYKVAGGWAGRNLVKSNKGKCRVLYLGRINSMHQASLAQSNFSEKSWWMSR
ncbi:hypothetical protein QYF61_002041 [Mycteria americana]|uniref:Uncharacterized protein n=1 Tax=Mycteria americana TaxID=33587 RepID=A0AAN7PDS3_MYCAM|nr:hypothetical protein QYF61_002041 [Mycteria americana]